MNDDQWRRVQEVFLRAAACPPAERTAVLDECCRDKPDLRAEVESLLDHDCRAGTHFLEPSRSATAGGAPAGVDGAGDWAARLVGQMIGRYQVVRLVAAGGMGSVFEAIQEQPARSVALKVMRPGLTAQSALLRFRLEPEVLGRLHHPNIAQVYEAGLHAGENGALPYFAMELIEGAQTLNAYVEQRQMSTRARLALFARVCEAVHHGHQKGIIHRDLKPANVLVDRDGEPKVIDFGVARSTDADILLTTQCTHVGELVGTLQYMSPEQCDADPAAIDTRTDIYSLGVMLYELLVGLLPYEVGGTTIYRAARIIREDLPKRPGEINPRLRGDIESILLKALEKERDKRYASAHDLAEDIRRHLAGEPTEARPPTRWTKLTRRVARHPVATTMCLCAAMIIVAGATTIGWSRYYIWKVNKKPHELVVTDDGSEARLLSLGGSVLHRWTGRHARARLVEVPRDLGWGPLAVLGMNLQSDSRYRRAVAAYDVLGDLNTPVWYDEIDELEIPLPVREDGYAASDFIPYMIVPIDIFDEPGDPVGPELVVLFMHARRSARVVCIYDLRGTLLYRVWHDGSLIWPTWLPEARLLCLTGQNDAVYAYQRGCGDDPASTVWIVLALRPELGYVADDWLPTEGGPDVASPAWYRCILPCDTAQRIRPSRLAQARHHDQELLELVIVARDSDELTNFFWLINPRGELEGGPPLASESYQTLLTQPDSTVPDPNVLYLGDLPPVLPEYRRQPPDPPTRKNEPGATPKRSEP